MAESPGAWIEYRFARCHPFVEVWQDLSADGRARALPYWLASAESDRWAYDQLRGLAAALIEADQELPEPLAVFTVGFLREGEPARRTGPRGDARRDMRIAMAVEAFKEFGASQRAACAYLGNAINLSPQAVESARRRGARRMRIRGE